ncbi:MAG: porin [Bacteroidetes bacterium MedPE-SWsnd-G1]|nr:MAG: porin [Bacteroidetes bacterium MedPE-SWsnd-G1]
MVKHYTVVVIAALLAVASVQSQKLTDTKFGKGMVNHVAKDSSWSVKFAPRIQMLSSTNWDYEDGNFGKANTSFLIRRARLKFDGFAFSPKFKYKIELGLSNRDISGGSIYTRDTPRIILDAVIKWNFHENFVLWAGQTKLPGNRERVISSANLQLVDRSLLNANFNIDRDIGLQLRHHFNLTDKFVVREIVSIAQGEGRNITYGNLGGHQFTGRLEFLPFGTFKSKGDYLGSSLQRESSVKLNFAIGFDHNNNAVKTRSNQGEFMITDDGFYETDINTVFIDAILKYKGFSFMAEYAKRTADDPIAKNSDNTPTGFVVREGTGLNIQSGYLFPKNWELTGRLSHVDVVDKDLTNQYTLGFSKYFAGHKLKIQSDLSYLNLDLLGDNLMYRLQLEVHF